jgi:hypothetical protein
LQAVKLLVQLLPQVQHFKSRSLVGYVFKNDSHHLLTCMLQHQLTLQGCAPHAYVQQWMHSCLLWTVVHTSLSYIPETRHHLPQLLHPAPCSWYNQLKHGHHTTSHDMGPCLVFIGNVNALLEVHRKQQYRCLQASRTGRYPSQVCLSYTNNLNLLITLESANNLLERASHLHTAAACGNAYCRVCLMHSASLGACKC